MPVLFVLDVPEFAPVVVALEKRGVGVRHAGYFVASAPDEITLGRRESGIVEALWFGVLTGGFEGRIAEFDSERLRIVD